MVWDSITKSDRTLLNIMQGRVTGQYYLLSTRLLGVWVDVLFFRVIIP